MGNLRLISRIGQWTQETERRADLAVLDMATDVHRIAGVIAPKDTRNLVNSGRIKRESSGHYRVIFGGGTIPYAKRRHYENKKNPGTLRYLERAGDTITRNPKRYLRTI